MSTIGLKEDLLVEDERWMRRALILAEQAAAKGEVPVGAVIVRDGEVLGQGCNHPISVCDATAHAEITALREASQCAGNYRLPGSTLYVTLEPCTMCVGAMVHARISRLVFGAPEPKAGAVCSQNNLLEHPSFNWRISWKGGLLGDECGALLSAFFRHRRDEHKSKKAENQHSSIAIGRNES